MEKLIAKMRDKRIKCDISCRALSEIIGVSFSTLSRLERGIGIPHPLTEEKIQKWIETDEGSIPRIVSERRVMSWGDKLKLRVEELEKRVMELECSVSRRC